MPGCERIQNSALSLAGSAVGVATLGAVVAVVDRAVSSLVSSGTEFNGALNLGDLPWSVLPLAILGIIALVAAVVAGCGEAMLWFNLGAACLPWLLGF